MVAAWGAESTARGKKTFKVQPLVSVTAPFGGLNLEE